MSDTFSLGGDPDSIRASGQSWKSFASSASSASSDIRSVDSASFQGDEGDTYRGKVNDDLPPRLDKTHEAWDQVGGALITYASTLESLQKRLAVLKSQHDSATQTADAKSNNLENAKSADQTHQQQQTAAQAALKPGETLPPSTYQSGTSAAQTQLTEANNAVQDTINKANQVHSEHKTALNTCCNQIEDAKGKRFEKPPGFWGKLKDSVVDWVKDHADVLMKISGVLKIISAIAGVLSFIPVLNFVMGPIALATAGAALLIDVGVKLATGKGSWTQIGIDAALMLLPGAGKLVGKGLKMTTSGTKALNGLKGAKAAVTLKTVNALKKSPLIVKGANGLTKFANAKVVWRVANAGRTPRAAAAALIRRRGLQETRAAIERNPLVRSRPGVHVDTQAQIAARQGTVDGKFECNLSHDKIPRLEKDGTPVRRDPETGALVKDGGGVDMPDPSKMDLGHEVNYEWSYARAQATAEGWSKQELSAYQNNPNHFAGYQEKTANRAAANDAKLHHLVDEEH